MADVVQLVGLQDWHVTFNCSTAKKGYSGTATLCRWVQLVALVHRGTHAAAVLLIAIHPAWWLWDGCFLRCVHKTDAGVCGVSKHVQAEAAQCEVWHWVS